MGTKNGKWIPALGDMSEMYLDYYTMDAIEYILSQLSFGYHLMQDMECIFESTFL
jgi:hypothetical protein